MGENDHNEAQQTDAQPELEQTQNEATGEATETMQTAPTEDELAKVKDQLLRTIAESENIRRKHAWSVRRS